MIKTQEPTGQKGNNFNKLIGRTRSRRVKSAKIFIFFSGVVAVLTMIACSQNANIRPVNQQSANQSNSSPETENKAVQINVAPSPQIAETSGPPKIFLTTCAECHGDNGEGTKKYPELKSVTTREEDPLSDEDLLAIINDAKSMGLSAKMPSFKKKLTEEEKQEIIRWLKTLK